MVTLGWLVTRGRGLRAEQCRLGVDIALRHVERQLVLQHRQRELVRQHEAIECQDQLVSMLVKTKLEADPPGERSDAV
jgi:hypothetical protein